MTNKIERKEKRKIHFEEEKVLKSMRENIEIEHDVFA